MLICPLNWGLGHASRIIPIVNLLVHEGFQVYFAAGSESAQFLKKEFPSNTHIIFENYKVRFSCSKSQTGKMIRLLFPILFFSIKEHFRLKRIVTDYNIDIIISDNRFGLWNSEVYSIFITHQLKVIFPQVLRCLEFLYQFLLRCIISRYDECWIPDFEGSENLAGVLSHSNNKQKNIKYIGPISRFKLDKTAPEELESIDILFVLSGPEPQRSLLEEIIYHEIYKADLNIVLVRGTSKTGVIKFDCESYDLLNTIALEKLIRNSKLVICRSGYSSIMDLVTLKKKAVLIPTPGQTEQEYLAKYLSENKVFYSLKQDEFKLEKVLEFDFNKLQEINIDEGNSLLNQIKELKKK